MQIDDNLSQENKLAVEMTERKVSGAWQRYVFFAICVLVLTTVVGNYLLSTAPANFESVTITIPEGSTVRDITTLIHDNNIVRNELALYVVLLYGHRNEPIQAGRFIFDEPMTVYEVATHLTNTAAKEDLVKLTLPEGLRIVDYARIASNVLSGFDTETFIEIASSSEGYLWPETYLVPTDYSEEDLFSLLSESSTDFWQTATLSNLSKDKLVILASVVEREANTLESMKMVAGILQNRLAMGMPLQADATIEYVLDTPLGELPPGMLAEQLRELDSPYNTYLYKGLPPTPIGNPGEQALMAALNPTASDFLFYITDDDGNFHYAKTFTEHQRNINRYLR